MKRLIILLSVLLSAAATDISAQSRTLKKVMELRMPKTADDDYCGTRGASVCWNPATQKYYAAFAGNAMFPMGVFNSAGKMVSDSELTALQDIRGLWYDPLTKKVSGNAYNDGGWFTYTLDSKGIPVDYVTEINGMNQPDENCAGSIDPVLQKVFFLNKGKISFYNIKTAAPDISVQIHWGRTRTQGPGDSENADNENTDYNHTTAVYTGIKGGEIGLLNKTNWQVELYDNKEGYLLQSLKLPEDAPVESLFNFACSNGIYWFFDILNRKWVGYK